MEECYQNKINEINILLNDYYEKERNNFFVNGEDNYKENLKIKNNIKELIINVVVNISISEIEKQSIKNELLKLLAENTGCVEDCKIAEIILNGLKEKKIINQNEINYFYSNENIGRWH
jgi:DNA-directed RNA polymerase beta' subunit